MDGAEVILEVIHNTAEARRLKKPQEPHMPPYGTKEWWTWWFAPRPGQPHGPLVGPGEP